MSNKKSIASLSATITERHSGKKVSENYQASIDDLLAIPWWLDRRPTSPRFEEAEALRKKLADKYKHKNIPTPVAPKKPVKLSPYAKKINKRGRLNAGIKVILQTVDKGQTISGRKLKAAFTSACAKDPYQVEDNGILRLSDYERCIRKLCKADRAPSGGRLRKCGRSYERTS